MSVRTTETSAALPSLYQPPPDASPIPASTVKRYWVVHVAVTVLGASMDNSAFGVVAPESPAHPVNTKRTPGGPTIRLGTVKPARAPTAHQQSGELEVGEPRGLWRVREDRG